MTTRQNEFEELAMPHSRSLLRVARRLTFDSDTAEDLVQETLLRAWRNFGQFQTGTNARAWLFRILFNAFYARGRKIRSTPVLVPLQSPSRVPELRSRADSLLLESAAVTRALEELSPEHRTVLLLAVVEGFTCREAAEILSLPIGTVMSRLSRARQALRDRIAPASPKLCRARASTD
ncbi:MAG: sigma-70 family RNA polymerase sigma factor [Candidatus Acidiferrales bacterium]